MIRKAKRNTVRFNYSYTFALFVKLLYLGVIERFYH